MKRAEINSKSGKAVALRNVTIPLCVSYQSWSRRWETKITADGISFMDVGLLRPQPKRPKNWEADDLRKMRDAFLDIDTPEEALLFLQMSGSFAGPGCRVSYIQVQEWVSFFRSYVETGIGVCPNCLGYEESLYARATGSPSWHIDRDSSSATGLSGIAKCSLALEAIAAVIEIDRLAGMEYRTCDYCNRLFSKEGKHRGGRNRKERYCSAKCGHRGGQKDRRAAERVARSRLPPLAKAL